MRGRCSVSTNSPPLKLTPGALQQHGHLQRKHVLAVQILVQAVVVARAVLSSSGVGRVWPAAWHRARKASVLARIAPVLPQRRVPVVRDGGERRIERLAQRRDRAGQRTGEVLVFAAAEAVPAMTTRLRKLFVSS